MHLSPFSQVCDILIKNKSYSLIPIIPGEKRPGQYVQGKWAGFTEWQQYAERLPTKYEIDFWTAWPNAGVGLLTGKVSAIIALDFDNREDLRIELEKIIPESPVKKIGSKGYTAFYQYQGEVNKKWSVDGETVIELLSDGRQTVLPPSLHPTGINYKWLTEETLLTIDKEKLPFLSREIISKIEKFFSKPESKTIISTPMASGDDVDRIKKALSYIPANEYDLWVRIGMSLKAHCGDIGFYIWDQWSATSEKYKPQEMQKKWNSFNGRQAINIGTLFYEAEIRGYKHERKEITDVIIDLLPSKRKEEKQKIGSLALDEKLLTSCPGLPGRMSEWILENMKYRHPALSLSVALTAVGALKGHRLRLENNLRTNLYICGLAPSGSGKNDAMDKVTQLFNAAGVGYLFSGEPSSDSAVLKLLINNRGRALLQWDEIGIALKEMTSERASVYKAAILKTMMKLFSAAGGIYFGKQYADHENKMKRQDIDQPHLCVFGASTPSRFYEALNSNYALDGFLARWLIFETHDMAPKRRKVSIADIPMNLVTDIQFLERLSKNVNPLGNIDAEESIRPKTVKFEKLAEKMLDEVSDYFEEQKNKTKGQDDRMEGLWGRATEHVCKLALTIEDSTDEISRTSVDWASTVVTALVKQMEGILKNKIADNDHHRKLNRCFEIIEKSGVAGLSKSGIIRSTQYLKKIERNEILETLLESEKIEMITLPSETKNKILFRTV